MAKRQRVSKGKTSREWRFYPSERDADKCRAALATYDAEVRARDVKWGVDRLPLLVEAELRDRFWAQMDILNAAIAKGSGVEVEEAVAATVRGVQALERRAIERGAEPVSGEVWEETTPQGAVIAVCRDASEIAKIRDDGRVDRIYTMAEIAAIVERWEETKAGQVTNKVKSLFDGATIESVKPKPAEIELDDEIPF
mgnify:FL=1|tara:strand:+ start:400 stop:990 length:591 start_codon:yes stop_codon:yes gene_type:complete